MLIFTSVRYILIVNCFKIILFNHCTNMECTVLLTIHNSLKIIASCMNWQDNVNSQVLLLDKIDMHKQLCLVGLARIINPDVPYI